MTDVINVETALSISNESDAQAISEGSDGNKIIKTTCPYCGVGCGVDAILSKQTKDSSYIESVSGNKDHPANKGRLCVKGSALDLTTESHHRLYSPRYQSEDISWTKAIDTIASRFSETIAEHGPDSVAFYLSGQLLTEDYYVANKLMKGFIGSANVDTNSRLCMASAVVGYKRAFGADAVPCSYEDLELSDLIILIGSNAAWTHPVLYQRIAAAKKQRPNMKVVLIDPRETASVDIADLHLAIKPSSDGFLFNGLLRFLIDKNHIDNNFIQAHTNHFDRVVDQVSTIDINSTSLNTGINIEQLTTFYHWFAQTEKTISFYSQGINQSATGSDKCNAIINCHLATAKIGKPGTGPFSITGQPNAMGGREVGGLANQLAAHMDFDDDDVDRVQRFWQSPTIAKTPGLKAVDMFDAIHDGKIKAVWIMATNPAVSLPNSDHIRNALKKCDFVAVSDYVENDTCQYADIILPATAWGEKDGTVTNSERRISRQRPLRKRIGDARHDWWQIVEVAKKMGFSEHFNYESPADIFREHAALSGFEQHIKLRDFDISALSSLSQDEYENLEPVQWPINAKNPTGTKRLFTDHTFYTPNKKANFIVGEPSLNVHKITPSTPLLLNTGRIRDQWHTMTRTGTSAKLLSHVSAPFIDVHPSDIQSYNLENQKLAKISNQFGEFIGVVNENSGIHIGNIFAPIHWTDQFAKDSIISAVISSENDPFSGQPESKAIPVSISPFQSDRWAVIAIDKVIINHFNDFLQTSLASKNITYWSKSLCGKESQNEVFLLGISADLVWNDFVKQLLQHFKHLHTIQFTDEINQDERISLIQDSSVQLTLYSHQEKEKLPSTTWLSNLLDKPVPKSPYTLILGETSPAEKIICSCFQVSEATITEAIIEGSLSTESLGKKLKCGTNCGSCIPELQGLINQSKKRN